VTGLHEAEPVRAVREALGNADDAWLVGGVVRDALLGASSRTSTSRWREILPPPRAP